MDKKKLSETDIRTKYITPASAKAGWDIQSQLREEVPLTDGMQQALAYSQRHGDLPFAFSSAGNGFLFHDCTAPLGDIESELSIAQFLDHKGMSRINLVMSSGPLPSGSANPTALSELGI